MGARTTRLPSARLVAFALVVLVGIDLRVVLLAVPPVLPTVQTVFGLDYTATGLLTALPVLVMGGGAWVAGRIIARRGGRWSVAAGLLLLALGGLARAIAPNVVPLFLGTLVLSFGIALGQTAIPTLLPRWFPGRIGVASAIFSDGLILGAALAAGLTVAPAAAAWRGPFVVWTIPVFVGLGLWLWLAPAEPRPARQGVARATSVTSAENVSGRLPVSPWHLGLLTGAGSLVFFGMNGWIAPYNQAAGHAASTPLALTVLNAAQLPVSLALTPFAERLAGRRWPFVASGAAALLAVAGWVWAPDAWQPLWAALLGGSSACVLALGIALPPLLARGDDVARVTATMLTISYGVAFVGPFAGGWLFDLTRTPATAFLPVGVAALTLIVLGALLPSHAALIGNAPAQQGNPEQPQPRAGRGAQPAVIRRRRG